MTPLVKFDLSRSSLSKANSKKYSVFTSMETSMLEAAVRAASPRIGLRRRGRAALAAGCVAFSAFLLGPRAAFAEESVNRVRAAVTDPSETPYPARSFGQGLQLEFHGNSETDVGYVKDEPGPNLDLEKSNDFRGRFVLGADLDYGFGQNFFF